MIAGTIQQRHCERSEAIHFAAVLVARWIASSQSLLAMTLWECDSIANSGSAQTAARTVGWAKARLRAVPTIESIVVNGGHAGALPTLRSVNVIASHRVARMRADDRLREAIHFTAAPVGKMDCFVARAPRNDVAGV
jgi:hypothetical protein